MLEKKGTYVPATVLGALEQNLSRGVRDGDVVLWAESGTAELGLVSWVRRIMDQAERMRMLAVFGSCQSGSLSDAGEIRSHAWKSVRRNSQGTWLNFDLVRRRLRVFTYDKTYLAHLAHLVRALENPVSPSSHIARKYSSTHALLARRI